MKPALTIDRLTAAYDRVPVLEAMNFTAAEGERVAILGANGAGKTTLLKAIIGLVKSQSGTILFGNTRLEHLPVHGRLALGIGYLPQRHAVFPTLTVEENILAAGWMFRDRRERRQRLEAVCDVLPFLPQHRHRRAGTLSGGERQIVGLAKVRMQHPKLLLLDEPTAGLAPVWMERIRQILEALFTAETAVLIVEQNAGFALDIANRICVMEAGRIAFDRKRGAFDPASFSKEYFLEK